MFSYLLEYLFPYVENGILENFVILAGMSNNNNNKRVAHIRRPGNEWEGKSQVFVLAEPITAEFLTFQVKMKSAVLKLSGIRLNKSNASGNGMLVPFISFLTRFSFTR